MTDTTFAVTLRNTTSFAPSYDRASSDVTPYPAFLTLTEDGDASIGTDPTGGTPMGVWHKLDTRWEVSSHLTTGEANALLEEAHPFLERVWQGHSSEWDGSNNVGVLDDDAEEASSLLSDLCRSTNGSLRVESPGDWLGSGESNGITVDTTDEEIAAKAEEADAAATDETVYLDGDVAAYYREERKRMRDDAEAVAS